MRQTVLLCASLLALHHPFAAADDPAWSTHNGDTAHTGFIDRDLMLFAARPAWQVTLEAMNHIDGLAIGSGRVYVTPSWGSTELVALSLQTGEVSWSKEFGNVFSVNPPAYDPDLRRVYVQTGNHAGDTYLRAYNAEDGSFVWRAAFAAQWERYLAPTVLDGVVYINGGYYGGAYAFSALTGDQDWFVSLPQYDRWTPTPLGDDKLLAYTSQLDVLDRASGTVLTTIPVPDYDWSGYEVGQSALVVGDLAFTTNGGRIIAFDLVAGDVAWTLGGGHQGQLVSDGIDLFSIQAGALSVRDVATGEAKWAWEVPSASFRAPVLAFRNHLVLGNEEATYVLDKSSREVVATWPIGGVLAYGDDHLIVGSLADDGRVTAIRLPSTPLMRSGFE